MKKTIIALGIVFLLANIAFGIILESFESFNLTLSSSVMVISIVFLLLISHLKIKDGFKLPLYLFSSACGIVEYIIGLFAEQEISDNWCYIVLVMALVIQVAFLIIANSASKKIR